MRLLSLNNLYGNEALKFKNNNNFVLLCESLVDRYLYISYFKKNTVKKLY